MGAEELTQCILDIETWLSTNAVAVAERFRSSPSASIDDLARLPAGAPDTLKGILSVHNGYMPVLDFVGLTCAEINEIVSSCNPSDKVTIPSRSWPPQGPEAHFFWILILLWNP